MGGAAASSSSALSTVWRTVWRIVASGTFRSRSSRTTRAGTTILKLSIRSLTLHYATKYHRGDLGHSGIIIAFILFGKGLAGKEPDSTFSERSGDPADPAGLGGARSLRDKFQSLMQLCDDPYQVAEGSSALVLITEWADHKSLDLARLRKNMRGDVFLDTRNPTGTFSLLDPARMAEAGFRYLGIGR